jgi:hypothetical protein
MSDFCPGGIFFIISIQLNRFMALVKMIGFLMLAGYH